MNPNNARKTWGFSASTAFEKLKEDVQTQDCDAIQAMPVLYMTQVEYLNINTFYGRGLASE